MNLTIDYSPEDRLFTIACKEPVVEIGEWPGWRREAPAGRYVAPAWPATVLLMRQGASLKLTWTQGAARARDALLASLQRSQEALKGSLPFRWDSPSGGSARSPRRHQLQAVLAMRDHGWRVMLADDMGLGKTSAALWALEDAKANCAVIVCPVSVKFNWLNEFKETLPAWHAIVINGSKARRADQFADAQLVLNSRSQVAVILNYDLLLRLTDGQRTVLGTYLTREGSCLILDEGHYVKDQDAERTKAARALAKLTQRVLVLGGTPVRNLIDDFYTQVDICRPGTWTSYTDFLRRYCVVKLVEFGKRRPVRKIVGTKNLDELNRIVNTVMIRRLKSEVTDLPPKVYTYPEIQLDETTRKVYNAMKDFARLEIAGAISSGASTIWSPQARSAVEAMMRCEQIAQGFVGGIPQALMSSLSPLVLKAATKIDGRPSELLFPNAPKLVWLMDTIVSIIKQGGAPVVFSRFNAPLGWIYAELTEQGYRPALLDGARSAEDRQFSIAAFQDGTLNVMLCQVKIAEGFNLTRSSDVLFLGRDWSPAINRQAEDRTHRMGQKGTVNVQIPIVRGTVETMIHRKLQAKEGDANSALRDLTLEELMEAL